MHNYVQNSSSRRKKVNYIFGESRGDNVEIENVTNTNYYQICTYKEPRTDKYCLRKFIINSKNEFIEMSEYLLTKKQIKKFYANKKPHEFKCYPSYNFDNIGYPNLGEVNLANSRILSNNHEYSGFAPF